MKLIVAIIKPFRLDAVREALAGIGVVDLAVTEVKGFGRQHGRTEVYRGAEYAATMVPKARVEIACADGEAAAIVAAVAAAAQTGAIGDGKIFVQDLGEALHIRTGATGEAAL